LIVMWPIPNAMMEFVAAFVDGDLAIVVGIAYWWVLPLSVCLRRLGLIYTGTPMLSHLLH
jgi:hypothetical protein